MLGQTVSTTDTRSVSQDGLRQDSTTGEPNNNTSWLSAYRRGRLARTLPALVRSRQLVADKNSTLRARRLPRTREAITF